MTDPRAASRRLGMLAGLAVAIGLASGGAAWLLIRLIAGLTNLALFHRLDWTMPPLSELDASPWLPVAAVGGAAIVSLLAKWAPTIRGHGIPEAMEAVLTRQSRVSPRTAIAKPTSIAVSIGTGAPFGAEGPIIVTGGALGSILGQVVPVTPSERRILLGCGAAGGTAAVFGAPMAAVVLAIELLLFEFSPRAIVPLVVSASVAGGVHVALFGSGPLFDVPQHEFSGLGQLWIFALLGVASGLLAVLLCRGLFFVEALYRRLPVGEFWHPIIGALGFASIGLAVPRVLGTGYESIQDVLSNRLALGTLVLLTLAKLVAWWVALGSGTSGSTLAPILLIAGAFGGAFGVALDEIAPGLDVPVGAMALVAMAATFGASIGASLTAIVFVFELTLDYQVILPLMLATVIANLVAAALLDHNLMSEKLAQKGIRIPRTYEPDVLRGTMAREAMTTEVETLDEAATVGTARNLLASGPHSAYPIVNADGECIGIVTRSDLLIDELANDEPIMVVAKRDVVTAGPDASLLDVLQSMIDENVDHIPIVEHGRLIGICTRTDVLRARNAQLQDERAPAGWHPSLQRLVGR